MTGDQTEGEKRFVTTIEDLQGLIDLFHCSVRVKVVEPGVMKVTA